MRGESVQTGRSGVRPQQRCHSYGRRRWHRVQRPLRHLMRQQNLYPVRNGKTIVSRTLDPILYFLLTIRYHRFILVIGQHDRFW